MKAYSQDILFLAKHLEYLPIKTLIIEESIHPTFNESNPKPLELQVIDYACILEKKNLEENDQEQDQDRNENQVTDEELTQEQITGNLI